MATDKEASCPTCSSDPNFAVICSFLNKFAEQCGITSPSFAELQDMLEDTQEVSQVLIDMHVKLLRKARKSFTADKWERALAKFCHTYSQQDGWELERFGYKKARLGVKVKLLKVLLETQFDVNAKFKTEVNKYTPSDLRLEPLGRDQTGLTYWCQFDPASHVRVYREDVDDETWELVAKDRDGLVQLIDSLSNGEGQRELNNILNEDSTSQEIEKPITDTGQNLETGENEEEDDSEEEASDDEREDEEENEDKKESCESDETKTLERVSSDDSKSADMPQAKLPDNDLKKKAAENGSNGAFPSSDNSENSLSGVDLSLKTEPRKCFSTSQQGNFYMIPDRHPLPETADILSQMSAKFNENKEIEDLSINSKKTKAEELEQSESNNPPKKVKFIDQHSNSPQHKPDENDQPISLKHNEAEKNDQPISLQYYKSENRDQPTSLQHYKTEMNDQPISLQHCKSEKNDKPVTLQQYKPEKNDHPTKLQHHKPENNDQPTSLQHYKPEKNDLPISLQNYKSEKNDRPISLLNYKPEKNDQPISLHYKPEKSDQSTTLQHCKPVENDQPVMLVKKDVKLSEQYNEPISLVTGNTAGSINEVDDSTESEFSDTMEEPVQHISGPGSGAECNAGNPRCSSSLDSQSVDEEAGSKTEFIEVIEEPIQFVFGQGAGRDCEVGNRRVSYGLEVGEENSQLSELEFSDVIEEPIQYIVGLGTGVECDVGNPKRFGYSRSSTNNINEIPVPKEPQFSSTIEEPVQYINGSGSGAECGVGSPRHVKDPSSSYSVATMGIECSMRSLTIQPFEPNFSDVIEDPIMFIQGSGYGHDCLTGNPDEKEDTSVEENVQKKGLNLSKNIDGMRCKEGSENKAGPVSPPFENFKNSIETVEPSKNIDSLTEGENSDESSRLKIPPEIGGIEQTIPLNDKLGNREKIETESINCNNLHDSVNNEKNSLSKKGSSPQGDASPNGSSVDLTLSIEDSSVKNTNNTSSDSSSHSIKCNISSHKGDVSEPSIGNDNKNSKHEIIDFSLNKLLMGSGVETSQGKDVQRMEDGASSYSSFGKSETLKNSKSNASIGLLDLRSKGEGDQVPTNDNGKLNEVKGNNSTTDQILKVKKRRDSSTTKAAIKNENGPLSPVFENSSLGKLNSIDPSKDTEINKGKDSSNINSNIETQLDKKMSPRKNVMLTNIIEVCLDNNTNSKDNSQLDIPEPINAKYNDLFSAKDLLNPPSRKNVINDALKEISKEEKKKVTSSKEERKIVSSKVEGKSIYTKGEGKSVPPLKEKCKSVSFSREDGKTVSPLKEESKTVSSLKEEGETVFSLKEEGETVPSLKEEGETISLKEEDKSVSSSKEEDKSVFSSKEEDKSVSSSLEEDKSISSSKEEDKRVSSSKEEDKSISSSKGKSKTDCSSKEERSNEFENGIKPANLRKEGFQEMIKCEVDKENLECVKVKNENLIPDESSKTEDNFAKKLDSDNDVKIKDEPNIKNEEKDLKIEEKLLKQLPRGRKSRTNSLCNEKEVEIPNKIRKTDKIEVKPTRRSTRRSNRSNSQSGLNSVSEDEIKKNENLEEKSSSVQKDLVRDQTTSDDKLIKSEDKEEIKETKESSSRKNILSPEDVPKGGPPNKNLNRKRRSSMRLSRSEEEGAEIQADEEEAGGKKPRLRGKARRGRSRGTVAISRPPPEASSSEEDDNVEKKVEAQKGVIAGRTRPTTRAARKTKANNIPATPPAAEPKKKKKGNSKQDEKPEADCNKVVKKQTPPKKSAKASKKSKEGNKRKEQSEENKVESDSESGNKKVKPAQETKKGKKSSKIPVKQRKTSKDEKQDSDEEEKEGDEQDEEEDEEEEEPDETNVKEKKEVKSEEKKDDMSSSQENLDKNNDDEPEPQEQDKPKPKKVRTPKKKTLLGLMESDLIHSKSANADEDDGSRVRQSRRIAQIKIKEEAERRAIEEATMLSIKDMKKTKEEKQPTSKKSKKKKGRSEMGSEDEDETFKNPVTEDKKLGRKKKKRKDRLKYDENRPWRSSSDSSSEEADEEEEHYEEEDDEEDIRTKQLVSDHEFSPESDLEGEPEDESTIPVRRARTAKKDPVATDDAEVAEETDQTEDYPCKKCGQPDHPEWILLCDKCDSGYHASCLRPPLMLIPEGDWFCPPCQHADLVNKLKETLRVFEKSTKKRENEELRRKRLAYVGISLANVLPTTEKTNRRRISSSEYSSSEEEETESSEEDEPVYQLRQRRTALQANYRFNDYDELINSAIQDEMELVKGAGNMGRGKDIANITEAEKGEAAEPAVEAENQENEPVDEDEEQGENWRPRVVPKITALPSLRKKPKKLTDLDRASDEDGDSDEDFKGSSEEEEYSSTDGGDSDDSEAKVPIRRSSRNRISRIDKEFINDDSESSDEPRRKKTRKLYASSSSESSDSTWGRRKRKSKTYSRIRTSKGGRKKKNYFDSDSDRPKKVKSKRPKIKYGLSEDDEDDGGPIRRTRGKKVSYLDIAGSDTEEEVIRRSRKLPSDDEDEFIPEKEGGEEEEAEAEEDEDGKYGGNDDEEEEDKMNRNDEKEEESSRDEAADKSLNDSSSNKSVKGPAVVVEPVKTVETLESQKVSEGEDIEEDEDEDDDDDDVEEEEIEEEIEEEVEEEEYESEGDEKVEEAKNLAVPKLRIVDTRDLIRKEPEIVRKVPPVTITVVKANPSAIVKEPPTHLHPTAPVPPLPGSVTVPTPPTSVPTPVIKIEDKKDEKEEKKEPVPAIRLVPSAKLLDPNKQRRVADESVIRGMLSGGGYYRPQRIPQAPPPQYRQRYQEQQRYSMYQPPPPPPTHQYYPTGGYYTNEDYGGYDEHMEQQVVGGGDEDGVFSGLVSYFSSQREDNLDS